MNIFDWHEDKTPEELANELGIDDFSVVENAGKKVIQTLETDSKNNINKVVNESKKNNSDNVLWTNDYSLEDLEVGMKVNINNDKLWKIKEIENDNIHLEIEINGKTSECSIKFEDLKATSTISTIEKNWNNKKTWISLKEAQALLFKIPDDLISDGTYVCDRSKDNFAESIATATPNFQSTKDYNLDFPFNLTKVSQNTLIEHFSISKLHYTKYRIRENTWKEIVPITSLEDIPIGTQIVNWQEFPFNFDIFTVKFIWNGPFAKRDDDITIHYKHIHKIVNLKDLTNWNYFYLKEKELDVENEDLWAYNCEFKDLRKGMRVNVFSSKSVKKIRIIKPSDKSIVLDNYKDPGAILKFNQIWKEFSISSEDLREVNKANFEEVGIPREKLKNDKLWKKIDEKDFHKLKVGMRVRKADGLWNDGDGGKISEKDSNWISIHYVSETTWEMYLVTPCFNFEVLKEDLEKTVWTSDFEIKQLTIWTKVRSTERNCIGTIKEITAKNIDIRTGPNIIRPLHKNFLKSFKVESSTLISKEEAITGLTKAELTDDSLWENLWSIFDNSNWDEIEKGMRIRKNGHWWIIKKNHSNGNVSIEYINANNSHVIDLAIEDIEVYKKDVEETKFKKNATKNIKAMKKKLNNWLLGSS